MQFMPPGASPGKLLDACFDTEKVIADGVWSASGAGRTPTPRRCPWRSTSAEAIDAGDRPRASLTTPFVFGGAFTGEAAAGLTKTVLLKTPESVQPVEKFMAQGAGERVLRDFKSLELPQALAVRLTGKFKTAFPDGKPADDTTANDEKKEDGKEAAPPAEAGLKEATAASAVILVGDSDLIFDNFCIQRGNFLGSTFVQPINDNLAMVQNMVEQLSGDSRLIAIRSRGAIHRPLESIGRLQARAEQQWQDEIKSLEDELQEARTEISNLQRGKGSPRPCLRLCRDRGGHQEVPAEGSGDQQAAQAGPQEPASRYRLP